MMFSSRAWELFTNPSRADNSLIFETLRPSRTRSEIRSQNNCNSTRNGSESHHDLATNRLQPRAKVISDQSQTTSASDCNPSYPVSKTRCLWLSWRELHKTPALIGRFLQHEFHNSWYPFPSPMQNHYDHHCQSSSSLLDLRFGDKQSLFKRAFHHRRTTFYLRFDCNPSPAYHRLDLTDFIATNHVTIADVPRQECVVQRPAACPVKSASSARWSGRCCILDGSSSVPAKGLYGSPTVDQKTRTSRECASTTRLGACASWAQGRLSSRPISKSYDSLPVSPTSFMTASGCSCHLLAAAT